MPAAGRADGHMNGAHLTADDLAVDDSPRGPQASCDRGILEDADFDVRGDERLILRGRRFDRLDPPSPIDRLTVGERPGEIIAIHAPKETAGVRLNSPRGFSFETDDLLPLQFGVDGGLLVPTVNTHL